LLHRNRKAVCWIVSLGVLSTLGWGCSHDHPHARFVARVDGSSLTSEDLAALGDTGSGGSSRARRYVDDWVISELLYQEAIRTGIPQEDDVRKAIDAAKRELCISAYLNRELGSEDTAAFTDVALRACFDSSAATFALREDVINLSYTLFSERDAANTFRSRVLRGTAWTEAIRQSGKDSLTRSKMLRVVDQQYFTHASLYPDVLWKLARSLGKDAVSFVVKTDEGYYVLENHGIKHQGATPDFEYVKSEVRHRLAIAQRRMLYEQLLRTLHTRHTVEISVDSTDQSGAETTSSKGG